MASACSWSPFLRRMPETFPAFSTTLPCCSKSSHKKAVTFQERSVTDWSVAPGTRKTAFPSFYGHGVIGQYLSVNRGPEALSAVVPAGCLNAAQGDAIKRPPGIIV